MSSQSKTKTKVKEQKIPDNVNARDLLPPELRNDPNLIIDDDSPLIEMAVIRAANMRENERRAKEEAKREEEERRKMREYEEKQRKGR